MKIVGWLNFSKVSHLKSDGEEDTATESPPSVGCVSSKVKATDPLKKKAKPEGQMVDEARLVGTKNTRKPAVSQRESSKVNQAVPTHLDKNDYRCTPRNEKVRTRQLVRPIQDIGIVL